MLFPDRGWCRREWCGSNYRRRCGGGWRGKRCVRAVEGLSI